ncbi:hypothetical protein T439DRAFT_172773 [Meredithblackwellia eburnea MCA 4105]
MALTSSATRRQPVQGMNEDHQFKSEALHVEDTSVDFGAFLRRKSSRPNLTAPTPPAPPTGSSSAYTPIQDPRPVIRNGKVAPVTGRMRQGAPRLGGLGLGGVGVAPPPPPVQHRSPPATPPSGPGRSLPPTPATASPPLSIRRKPVPSPDLFAESRPTFAPAVDAATTGSNNNHSKATSTAQVFSLPPAPALPLPPSGKPMERPFLSPEMERPSLRTEAFALDRPVPETGVPHPVQSTSSSPATSDSPGTPEGLFGGFLIPDDSPDLSRVPWTRMDSGQRREEEEQERLRDGEGTEEGAKESVFVAQQPSTSQRLGADDEDGFVSSAPSSAFATPVDESKQVEWPNSPTKPSPQLNSPVKLSDRAMNSTVASPKANETEAESVKNRDSGFAEVSAHPTMRNAAPPPPSPPVSFTSPSLRNQRRPSYSLASSTPVFPAIIRQRPLKPSGSPASTPSPSVSESQPIFPAPQAQSPPVCERQNSTASDSTYSSQSSGSQSSGSSGRSPSRPASVPPPRPPRRRPPALVNSDVESVSSSIPSDSVASGSPTTSTASAVSPITTTTLLPTPPASDESVSSKDTRKQNRLGMALPAPPIPSRTTSLHSLSPPASPTTQAPSAHPRALPMPPRHSPALTTPSPGSDAPSVDKISLSEPIDDSFFFSKPVPRHSHRPQSISYSALGLRLPSNLTSPLAPFPSSPPLGSGTTTSPSSSSWRSSPPLPNVAIATFDSSVDTNSRDHRVEEEEEDVEVLQQNVNVKETSIGHAIETVKEELPSSPEPEKKEDEKSKPAEDAISITSAEISTALEEAKVVAAPVPVPVPGGLDFADDSDDESDGTGTGTKLEDRQSSETRDPNEPSIDATISAIGVAAAGIVVSGGMAVGYSAWRGLSAVASAGWSSWRGGAASVGPSGDVAREQPTQDVEVDEAVEPLEDMTPVREVEVEKVETAVVPAASGDEEALVETTLVKEVVSTQWGELDFPAPKGEFLSIIFFGVHSVCERFYSRLRTVAGFAEDLAKIMADLTPPPASPVAPEAQIDDDDALAQLKAYNIAARQHEEVEALSPEPPMRRTLATLAEDEEPSGRASHNRRSSMYSAGLEDRDDILDFLAPDFSANRKMKGASKDRPLYFAPPGLSGQGGQGRISPPSLVSHDSQLSIRPPSVLSQSTSSITSNEKKRGFFGSIRSSLSPQPARDSASRRARSQSMDSTSSSGSFPSSSASPPPQVAATLKRTPSLASSKTIAALDREVSAASSYISYGTGKRRGSTASSGSATSTEAATSPPMSSQSPQLSVMTRKSSLRRPANFSSPGKSSKRVSAIFSDDKYKTIYSVRFANADGGLGLRSVAEDEAERAGGESHGKRWVGVGRGRYGNLTLVADKASDEFYAEQVATIKSKWRSFGSEQGRDWARVKVD